MPLPHGLSFGASRKAVTAALGKPTRGDQYGEGGEVYWLDRWKRVGKYPLCAEFVDDKLVMVEIGQPLP